MRPIIERAINARSASQFGLITREQAHDAGVTNTEIAYRVRIGRWVRIERGVYRVAAAPAHDLGPLLAAALSTGGAAASRSALHLFGLGELPPRPELIVPRTSRYSRAARVCRTDIRAFKVVKRQGIPTVDVVGALLTAAAVIDPSELNDVVASAVSRRLVSPPRALATLGKTAGRKGATALRAALNAYVDAAAEESALERRIVRLLREAGLPAPIPQHRVRIDGSTYRLDHAWPAEKVALETDGFEFHSSRRAFENDRRRRNRLELAGWLVLNATRYDVDAAPRDLVAQVAAALAMRASAAR